jgi:hypothetical protein
LKKVPISHHGSDQFGLLKLLSKETSKFRGGCIISYFWHKKICSGHFSTIKRIFHTTVRVHPGSGTGIPVLRSSSTAIPVLKKSAGIANPREGYQFLDFEKHWGFDDLPVKRLCTVISFSANWAEIHLKTVEYS